MTPLSSWSARALNRQLLHRDQGDNLVHCTHTHAEWYQLYERLHIFRLGRRGRRGVMVLCRLRKAYGDNIGTSRLHICLLHPILIGLVRFYFGDPPQKKKWNACCAVRTRVFCSPVPRNIVQSQPQRFKLAGEKLILRVRRVQVRRLSFPLPCLPSCLAVSLFVPMSIPPGAFRHLT